MRREPRRVPVDGLFQTVFNKYMAFGPAAGLDLVDALPSEPALSGYYLLPSVRGDLLTKLRRSAEARTEFERAAALTRNARERALLVERAARSGPLARIN